MATIYEPKFLQPYNSCIDMTSNQDFTAVIQGVQATHYQLLIYNNDTSAQLYDSTKTAISPVLYNGDTLTIVVPSGSAGVVRELKWTLAVWNGAETLTSREKYFTNYELPTVSLTPDALTEQFYEFIATYAQAQSISVKKFKFTLYDSLSVEIENSDWQFNGSVLWTFDGFLSGETYYVEYEVYDLNNVYATSGLVAYTISYTEPSISVIPIATNLEDYSAIQVDWSGVYTNVGDDTGTTEFVVSYLPGTDFALYIHAASTAFWEDLRIGEDFTNTFVWRLLDTGFTGDIIKQENTVTSSYFTVGYDGSRFYYNISGDTRYSRAITLTANMLNIIILTPTNIYINVGSTV